MYYIRIVDYYESLNCDSDEEEWRKLTPQQRWNVESFAMQWSADIPRYPTRDWNCKQLHTWYCIKILLH